MIESDPLNQPSDNTEDRPITPPPTETLIPNAPLKINPKNPANEYQIKLLTDDLGINVPEYLTQNLFKNNGPFSDINWLNLSTKQKKPKDIFEKIKFSKMSMN